MADESLLWPTFSRASFASILSRMKNGRRLLSIVFALSLVFPFAGAQDREAQRPEVLVPVAPSPGSPAAEVSAPELPVPEVPAPQLPISGAQEAPWLGRWEGSLTLEGSEIPATLRVFQDGALMDLPSERAYGWPVDTLRLEGGELFLSISLGAEPLAFTGTREGAVVSGALVLGERAGTFALEYSSDQPDRSGDRGFDTGKGELPGTLEIPVDAELPVPLVILIAGSGTTDRDGNNWQVPGRNDSLKLLAKALARSGLASYRYDKRGSGQAYRLGQDERSLVFADHVADAAACIRSFEGDGRFSTLIVFGHGDGALVGAAALRGVRADALVAMGVSGVGLRRMIDEAAAQAPEEYKAEIDAILAELEAGRFVDEVSPYLENLFRRSFQPYLASWLGYDLGKELADLTAAGTPVLLIQGDLDLQVTMEEFDLLRASAPKAEAVLLPGANHMMKQVSNDVEENYASFSDPSFPLSPGLVMAIQEFLTRVPARQPEPDPGSAP